MDARKTEAEAELVRPGCWGQLMERLDTFNRRFRPKCRRAVKSQVEVQKLFIRYIQKLERLDSGHHRRRMEREVKAKVVVPVWGADFVQFLATLAVLPRSV